MIPLPASRNSTLRGRPRVLRSGAASVSSRSQHCCCGHSMPPGLRLLVLFPKCLAARPENPCSRCASSSLVPHSPALLELSVLSVPALGPSAHTRLSWPLLGTPPFTRLPLTFLRSSLNSSQEHSFRTTALASPEVSFAYFPVSVPLGSPSFIPLPGFSQVNLLSLQPQSL